MQFPSDGSKDEMVVFLEEGGIDTKTFDSRSVKKLQDLHAECSKREVSLHLINGCVVRMAMSVKLLIFAEKRQYLLREKYRIVDGTTLVKHNQASASETRIYREEPHDTARRCLQEELSLEVPDTAIKVWSPGRYERYYTRIGHNAGASDFHYSKTEEYPSSAYSGITTIAYIDWFEVDLDHRPWTEPERAFVDNETTTLVVQWEDQLDRFRHLLAGMDKK